MPSTLEAPPASKPRILLTDSNRWALSPRLAISLTQAGCEVSAVGPTPGHPLMKTRAVRRVYHYSGLRPIDSLVAAIRGSNPDLVVPCCDRSVGHLHELYATTTDPAIKALIERSLGNPASHAVVASRLELLALAEREGVRIPRTIRVDTPAELAPWQAAEKFPWVLKADGTWGGCGVKIVQSGDQVAPSFEQLHRVFGFRQAAKRLAVNRDSFWLRAWRHRGKPSFVVQAFIPGRPANCGVFCWQGRVIAGIGVEVITSEGATGPASVVRVVDNVEMMFAAEKIAARLNLSGFFGLDFMIEEATGAAYLIEMNPRCTPLSHLRLGERHDLVGALWSQLSGQAVAAKAVTQNDRIAYFPQSTPSDNELFRSSYYDVPEGEPELIAELNDPWLNHTLVLRLLAGINRLRRPSAPAARVELKSYPAPDYAGPTVTREPLPPVAEKPASRQLT